MIEQELQLLFVRTIIVGMTTLKPRRGRPPKDNNATARFEIRCTPAQKLKWEKAAADSDLSLATWVKTLADDNA